jgi:hypothetical protein
MTYQLNFLKKNGTPACFMFTQCMNDEHAKAIARSILKLKFAAVDILCGDEIIHRENKYVKGWLN